MKNNINKSIKEDRCTGCGACMNICPVSAISMGEDTEGFLYPFIDENICMECGKCFKACPVISYENNNSDSPKICAVRADDRLRAVSSSGGVFTVLAENTLSRGGVVCGAAWDEEMCLRHVIIDNKEDLSRLRGSKYVQSNIGDVYRDIKEILSSGREVLFTGTPCQNAALRNVLGKNYENLLMVDIICHGVPSQKSFSRYLKEISNGRKPVDVDFRNKRFGWVSNKILVRFSNNDEYVGSAKDDAFEIGFYRNLTLAKNCSDCKFSAYPREGDISMGDFWGISGIDPAQNDGKGTSIVFINNKKGELFFKSIYDRFYKVNAYNFDTVNEKIKNRTHALYPANKNRELFFREFSSGSGFYDAVKKAVPESFKKPAIKEMKTYDIGLVSNYLAGNFGGSLTQYALYKVLNKLGYSVGMIERPLSAPNKIKDDNYSKIYLEIPYDMDDILPRYTDLDDMEKLNDICNCFVVGSDQLFQYALYNALGKFVSLSWANDRKKKIAYAGSFGHGKIWGDKNIHAELGYFLQKFDAVSVRERDAVDICRDNYGVKAECVLDPVFLCDAHEYRKLAAKSKRKLESHYISSYILDPSEDKQKMIRMVMSELDLPSEIFSEFGRMGEYIKDLGDLNVVDLKVEERLDSIINCDFIITDSFHGTCFAIIMGKPFISILNADRGASRFTSLLEMFGIEERLVTDSLDLERNKNIIYKNIDYSKVNEILEKERQRCIKWLADAIKAPKANVFSDYDEMKALVRRQNKMIKELKNEIVVLSKSIRKGAKYIEDIYEYLDYLNDIKSDHLILISVKDTPGLALNSTVAQKLQRLGIQNDMQGKHSRSFVAVLDSGNNIFEELGTDLEPIEVEVKTDLGKKVTLVSRVYLNGNESRIVYDGMDHSVNLRGFNIVLVSKDTEKIEDSVCFDLHLKDYRCFRKQSLNNTIA